MEVHGIIAQYSLLLSTNHVRKRQRILKCALDLEKLREYPVFKCYRSICVGLIELHTLALSLQDWGFDKFKCLWWQKVWFTCEGITESISADACFLRSGKLVHHCWYCFSFLNVLYFLSKKEVCFINKWKHFICGFFFRSSFWSLTYRTS